MRSYFFIVLSERELEYRDPVLGFSNSIDITLPTFTTLTHIFNFINSLNSPYSKRQYVFRLEEFLNYCKLDLHQIPESVRTENYLPYR